MLFYEQVNDRLKTPRTPRKSMSASRVSQRHSRSGEGGLGPSRGGKIPGSFGKWKRSGWSGAEMKEVELQKLSPGKGGMEAGYG